MVPTPSTATPCGPEKSAPAPGPSALPKAPGVPANTLTTPDGVIFRTTLFCVSATYRLDEVSTATPLRLKKRALELVPLMLPSDAEPANVVTTPAEFIVRMVLLAVSAT